MAAAVPEFDFQKCATPWLVKPDNPTDPAIGDWARISTNCSGLVYATHPTDVTLAYMLLSCGYGQTVAVTAGGSDRITQGEKIYMVDSTATARPTFTNAASGNNFAGYALPATETAAAATELLAAGATGDILLWSRPE
jgi:hypothetical protein